MNYKEIVAMFKQDPFFGLVGEELFLATEEVSQLNDEYTLYEFAEKRAKKHISDWLRTCADHIDSGKWPMIYDTDIPDRMPDAPAKGKDKDGRHRIMENFNIAFSHPWPG